MSNEDLKNALKAEYVAAGGDAEDWDSFVEDVSNMTPKERWVHMGLDPEAFDRMPQGEIEVSFELGKMPKDPGPPPPDDDLESCAKWFKEKNSL